jgi:hypothetical protein
MTAVRGATKCNAIADGGRGVWQNGGDLGDLTHFWAENALFQKERSPPRRAKNLSISTHGLRRQFDNK